VLAVPSITLTMSDAGLREQCKAKCAPRNLAYRVVNKGYGADRLRYPASCYCISPAERAVWEKWRDAIW